MFGYFRMRPRAVQALHFDGGNQAEAIEFCATGDGSAARETTPTEGPRSTLMLETPEGPARLDAGDWIVKDVAGEFRRERVDTFEQKYREDAGGGTLEDRLRVFVAQPIAQDVIAEIAAHAGTPPDPETIARLTADRCRDELRALIGW